MKKLTLLLALLMVFCTSCTGTESDSKSNSTSYKDENGNLIIENEGGRSVVVSKVPVSVPYNGKSITWTDISFYQDDSDDIYTLFIVTTFDVSELDDSELHQLSESDLSVDSNITCDANEYDFAPADSFGCVLMDNNTKLVIVESSSFSDVTIHGFENSGVNCRVSVTQEETYEYERTDGTQSERNKTEKLSYNITTGNPITDFEKLEDPLHEHIVDMIISSAADFW